MKLYTKEIIHVKGNSKKFFCKNAIPLISIIFTFILTGYSHAAETTIYRHVDEDGTIHLTNRPDGDARYQLFGKFKAMQILQAVGTKGAGALSEKYGTLYGISPKLINAIIQVESGFNPDAVSPAGAEGLMQIMPETGQELGLGDAFDADQNVDAGVRYLKSLIDQFSSLPLALAAYNAGPGNVKKYGGIPPFEETQQYVKKVLALYNKS